MSDIQSKDFIRQIIDHDLFDDPSSKVITRFPPEPNGYLHLGHAKSIYLNFSIADERKGTTYLRFDDTNPIKEDAVFAESIKKDVQWLGFEWHDKLTHASDYFEKLHQAAVSLIKNNLAYVDSSLLFPCWQLISLPEISVQFPLLNSEGFLKSEIIFVSTSQESILLLLTSLQTIKFLSFIQTGPSAQIVPE